MFIDILWTKQLIKKIKADSLMMEITDSCL